MATRQWLGDAQKTAQVTTATPATIQIGDIFTLTINGKDAVFVAVDTVVASVVAGLVAAISALTDPEWAEAAATDDTTLVTLTAVTPGKPFVVTSSAVDGGGADTQTLALNTTDGQGPNDFSVAENWIDEAGAFGVPASGDDLFVDNSAVSILYGLDQSLVAAWASLSIGMGFTGEIGLPRTTSTGYAEYRDTHLKLPRATAATETTLLIGKGIGQGSARINIDAGDGRTSVMVMNAGISIDADTNAIAFKGTHVSNKLEAIGGTIDLARFGDEAAVLATMDISGNAVVFASDRVTLTTVNAEGSSRLALASAMTTLSVNGSSAVTITGSGAITTLNCHAGTVDYQGSGTITTLNMDATGSITFASNTSEAVAVTTTNGNDAMTLLDPFGRVTVWTITGVDNFESSTIVLGPDRTVVFT